MNKGTKVKNGTLVKLIDELLHDPKYQLTLWDDEYYFLREPKTFKLEKNIWIKKNELCMVVNQDYAGLIVLNRRGQVGWIGKDKMEIVK